MKPSERILEIVRERKRALDMPDDVIAKDSVYIFAVIMFLDEEYERLHPKGEVR